MKSLFLLLSLLLLATPADAGLVTSKQALAKAAKFMSGKSFKAPVSPRRAKGASTESDVEAAPFYVFNATDGGFVIVSGDDRAREILGYSKTGTLDLDNLPDNLRWWLDEYARQIESLDDSAPATASAKLTTYPSVATLLTSQWHQREPYNKMCPDEKGYEYNQTGYNPQRRCLVGCVATAMAQVMYYWQWPKKCPKLPGYEAKTFHVGSVPANTFRWDLMKDSYAYNDISESAKAVALLSRYCGQAVKMKYSPSASGASVTKDVMTRIFQYSLGCREVNRYEYSATEWDSLIYQEIAAGRPVLFSGRDDDSGHEFVIDGYNEKGLFHINWGWGWNDESDYYVLSAADPERKGLNGGSSTEGYCNDQSALIGLRPAVEGEIYPYATWNEDTHTATFYYDGHSASRRGVSIDEEGISSYSDVTTVVIDTSLTNYHPTNTAYWFYGCKSLTEIKGIENIRTDETTDMNSMFFGCENLEVLDLSGFNTEKVTDMNSMFSGCSRLKSIDLSNFNTSNVTKMASMFSYCSSLKTLDLSNFNTSNVTNMNNMFGFCSCLESINLSSFNTEKVTDMNSMFGCCNSLKSLDLSGFNTSNVNNMGWMFHVCNSLENLNLSSFNTKNVSHMDGMFLNCSSLNTLDLSSFNTSMVNDMMWMFCGCGSLTTIIAGEGWSNQMVHRSDDMFSGCYRLVGGQGTIFDFLHTDCTYARIDGGLEAPGYFTACTGTGINSPQTFPSDKKPLFNLQGQRLSAPQRGIHIIGGKKVMY